MKPIASTIDLLDRSISLRNQDDRRLVKTIQAIGAALFTLILSQPSLVRSHPIVSPIVSDGSLPSPTIVTASVNGNLITGGTQSGGNLFHSFDLFSVPALQVVKFQPDAGIQNIITRVTGRNSSVIDGEIQSPGNFFLINPNGISFGAQSSLNIGGSFFATTAPVLKFSDGKSFGTDRSIAPILSVNVPIGVQWGSGASSGKIQNFGNLSVPEALTLIAPEIEFNQATATGRSLDIQAPVQLSLNHSELTTSNGGSLVLRVGDLSAQSSLIASSYFSTSAQTGKLTIQATNDVVLDKLSFVEAKTALGVMNPGNNIEISGRSIRLRNGSTVTTQSLGNGDSGNIILNATDRIALLDDRSGTVPNNTTISSGTFLGENTRSGNINLTAPEITIANQALVQSTAVTASQQTGDIRIQASRGIEIDNSIISNLDFSEQRAGSMTFEAPTVRILNGSLIESNILNNIQGSTISILASDRLLISDQGTAVRTQTTGSGQGGNVSLQGNQILVTDGAIVSTDTAGSSSGGNLSVLGQDVSITEGGQLRSISSGDGDSGMIRVEGSDRILIKGQDVFDEGSRFLINVFNTSSASFRYIPVSQLPPNSDPRGVLLISDPINSSTPVIIPLSLSIDLNEKYTGIKASSYGNGKAGNIDLLSPLIDIRFFSLISNNSIGLGDSAKISIQAKEFNLNSSTILSSTIRSKRGGSIEINADKLNSVDGSILASTIEGDGGIITLNVRDRLTISKNTTITARASNLGKGGIITINNENGFIIAEPNTNNDILATARQGQGGVISIRSAGVFNIFPRQIQGLGNDILASSETGIQGTIILNLTQQDVRSSAPKLSELILDRSQDISPSCPSIVKENRLIITGQGGRMLSPAETLNLLSLETSNAPIAETSAPALVEATHWQYQTDGSLALLPSQVNTTPDLIAANCYKLTGDRRGSKP